MKSAGEGTGLPKRSSLAMRSTGRKSLCPSSHLKYHTPSYSPSVPPHTPSIASCVCARITCSVTAALHYTIMILCMVIY